MALVDVIKSCLDSINQISDHIEGATLYLDGGCTESFQFLGAFPLLLQLGVRAVCSLENMSPLDTVVDWKPNFDPVRKIVVITSRLLSDAHRYILRCLSMHQGVRHCTIFTSISEWIWRYACDKNNLWRQVIKVKYGQEGLDWRPKKANGVVGVGVWKEIWKESDWCWDNMTFRVGKGNMICFWTDVWCSDSSLAQCFPHLFGMAAHQSLTIEEMWDQNSGQGNWNLHFLRDFNDWEIELVGEFLHILRGFKPSLEEDSVIWRKGRSGQFRVKEAYSLLTKSDVMVVRALWDIVFGLVDVKWVFPGTVKEIAHSAYPDSPLGPDAFHEYESLLVLDYEELVKKCETKSRQSGDTSLLENLTLEDEGWSQLGPIEESISQIEARPSPRDLYQDNSVGRMEDVGQKLVVSVHHFPMILCPFSPRVFILPSEGAVAEAYLSTEHEDSLSPGLPPLSTGLPPDGDDIPPGATLTAHFLYHLTTKMDLKMEIFSFGNLSKTVGKILTDMSSLYDVGRRKRSAGERTTSSTQIKGSQTQPKHRYGNLHRRPLDVQIPLGKILCEEDSTRDNFRLLESIEAFLCGWNSGSSDAQIVDLVNLSAKLHSEKSPQSEIELLSGSFVAMENFHGTPYLETILDRRMKDGTILVKKWLQETLRREKMTLNVKMRPGFATKSDLQPMIKALTKSQSCLLRNKGIIQLAAATLFTLDELHSSRWDVFTSAEKILSVSAGDTSQSLAAQIGYILAGENFPTSGSGGPFSWQEEHLLKEAIVDAVLENPAIAKLKFLDGLTEELEANINKIKSEEAKEDSLDQLKLDDFDDDQWGWITFSKVLHKLSSLKRRNIPLREGALALDNDFSGDPSTSKGLLYKLLTRVLGKYEVPGLDYHSSTVGRLFKSGFGRFGLGQAKPSLADQNVILVFVIGGINGLEVREAQEALSESGRPDIELIIGGTTLLTPDDMLDLLLGNSSYI
ncbi:Sec1 family domain-containing protein MIP3 [Vitis vinifera]|uniref:Sec1 family domain-containing protein MIP3 n=1 Tax=Vitis vinifera TaxID=29760 RepID=A0A438D088_VITVI|nr:Sec1 family domain-containing protein MIP3 [Vitis vinifera]